MHTTSAPAVYVELAPFRSREGVADEAMLRAIDDTEQALRGFPGFLSRETVRLEDGGWIDIVHWRDHVAAEQAMEAAGFVPAFRRFFDLLEPGAGVRCGRRLRLQQAASA